MQMDHRDELLNHVRALLATTPARWLSLTQILPPDLLARRPAPEEWSAIECLVHLLDTERVFPVRVQAFLAGQNIVAFDPDREGSALGERTAQELAADYARLRAASLDLLARLSPADLVRGVEHSELGHVTLSEMLREWGAHDLNHTVQAERALMQPFIAGSGPWRSAFAEHDVHVGAPGT
jgi:hypothetical protein